MPFVNLSGEPEQEYFSEGISEDIITALSKLRWFYVIARNSSFSYRGKSVHHRQIGEELGVGYVVEGSVRKDGDHVRINAQLVDVASGSQLWAERYDRDLADVFAVQDEITQAVVAAIEPQLYAAEDFRARRKTPDNMDAWDLVMRALSHYWRVTRQDNLVAQALLEKAIAVDPGLRPGAQPAGGLPHVLRPYGLAGNDQRPAQGRTRGAGGDPRRQRGCVGALCAGQRLSVQPALRRLHRRIRAGAAAQPEFLAGTRHLRRRAVLSRPLGGGRPRRPRGAEIHARAIPLPRSIAASPPIASMSAGTTRRRSACRARRCASAPISSAPTAC